MVWGVTIEQRTTGHPRLRKTFHIPAGIHKNMELPKVPEL